MSFAKRLRNLRQSKGMSREQLAEAAGLGRGTVRDYEQGLREPTLRSAFRLAEVLGVPVEEFKNGVAEEGQPAAPTAPKPKGRPRKPPAVAQEGRLASARAPAPSGQKKPAKGRKKGKGGEP